MKLTKILESILGELNLPKPEDAYKFDSVKSKDLGYGVYYTYIYTNVKGDKMEVTVLLNDKSKTETNPGPIMYVAFGKYNPSKDQDEEESEESEEEEEKKYKEKTGANDMLKVMATAVEAIKQTANKIGGMNNVYAISFSPSDKKRKNIYHHYIETLFPDFDKQTEKSYQFSFTKFVNKNFKVKNKLSEIGDASNPLNYKETSNETTPISTRVKYEFSIGEDTYIVGMSITKLDLEEPENKDLPKGSKAMAVYFGLKQKNSTGDYTSSTNKGDQYKIMATVSQIIKDYVKDHPEITEIKYETDDKARHRLYKAYLKNNNSQFKNWDIKEKGDWIYIRKPIEKKKGLFQRMFKENELSEIGDASKQPYGPIDLITDDEAERQYGFETESGTLYEVKVETFYRGPGRPVIARVNFGTIGEEGDISYDTQTGENDIYRVMATIVQIVKKDLKSNHADIIEFSPSKREGGKDKDPMSNVRTKLYSKYIKGQFPNAEVTKTLHGDIQVKLI